MPYVMLSAYLRALPRIEAEETIKIAQVTAYGGGNLSKDDAREYMRDLQKAANGGKAPKRKRATNKELREMFGGKS